MAQDPPVIARADDALYGAERVTVALLLLTMGAVVFLDVLHRVSSRAGTLLSNPFFVAGAFGLGAVLALRTRGDALPLPKGIAIGVGIAVAERIYVAAVPNGLVWSQSLALALTLWLGLLGASLAAHDRRHLALDIGSKLWPPALRPKIAAVGHVVTALFCFFVAILGMRSVAEHWDLWTATQGAAGTLSGLAIPKWVPALSVPYGMTVIALRFLLEAWRVGTGRLPVEVDELAQLGISTTGAPP